MRYFILFLLLLEITLAGNLEVSANNFYHKDGEQKAVFSGDVIVTQDQNKITSNKITVLLDEKGEAKEYIATGNVHFTLRSPKRYIIGKSYKLIYYPIEDKYILIGNVYIKDKLNDREVYGDEIIIDNKHGTSYAKSKGKKKVKFIFKVKSK
jgi:lipopolysaccharide export system protein LptA